MATLEPISDEEMEAIRRKEFVERYGPDVDLIMWYSNTHDLTFRGDKFSLEDKDTRQPVCFGRWVDGSIQWNTNPHPDEQYGLEFLIRDHYSNPRVVYDQS